MPDPYDPPPLQQPSSRPPAGGHGGPPPLPHRPPVSAPPMPLGYSTGANVVRPQPRTPFGVRVVIGCLGYFLFTAAWFGLGALVPQCRPVVFPGWLLMTGALLGLALYLRIRYGFSGVGYGILITLGVFLAIGALLIVGFILLLIVICGKGTSSNTGSSSTSSPGPTTVYPYPFTTAPAGGSTTEPTTEPTTAPTTAPAGQ